MGFCSFSQALLAFNKGVSAADLLTFVGTVNRLAQDHLGSAWISYEHAIRANAVADLSIKWNHLDQEAWALATVSSGRSSRSVAIPQKREPAVIDGMRGFALSIFASLCMCAWCPSHKVAACSTSL